MPSFRWKGRNASGQEIAGTSSAPSIEALQQQLRTAGILTTQISEGGREGAESTAVGESFGEQEPPPAVARMSATERLARDRTRPPRRLRGFAIAGAFALGALTVGYFGPITVCRCERVAERVDCTLSERDLGLFTIREQSLSGVTTVEIESNKGLERVGVGRTRARENERLVLGNASGATIRPSTWDQSTERVRINGQNDGGELWVGTSTDGLRTAVTRFLSERDEPRMSLWQGQSVPLIISAVLLSIAVVMTLLGVLSLFKLPTALIYAGAERLAARMDQKRRR